MKRHPVDPFVDSEYDNPMDPMMSGSGSSRSAGGGGRRSVRGLAAVLCVAAGLGLPYGFAEGRDLLVPKEQETTEFEPTETPSLDVQQKGVPQSLFTWIKMARGYDVEWDTFGRKGWYTQDPRLKPIAPGTTVFTPDTAAVYIVFEVAPLEDPAQFAAQVFRVGADGKTDERPAGIGQNIDRTFDGARPRSSFGSFPFGGQQIIDFGNGLFGNLRIVGADHNDQIVFMRINGYR